MDSRDRITVVLISIVVVIWILLLVLRLAVVPFDEEVEENPAQTDVRIGFLQSLDSLNPYVGLTDASNFYYSLVYDCLTTIDEDVSPTGNLAISWWKVPVTDPAMVASGDPYGSVWEYNLTHNAVWHDGVQFTADDVVYNLNLNSQHYDSFWAYQPHTYFIKEAEKVDNYTVRIHFWDRATGESMPVAWGDFIPIHILPKHLLEQLPGGYAYIGMNWTGLFPGSVSPGLPVVGTGPWMGTPSIMSEWTAGNHVTLVRNPNYHWKADKLGAPEIRVDELVMRFFQDSTSLVLAFESHELDVARFPPTAYDAMKDAVDSGSLKDITCYSGPSCAQGFVYLSYWMTTAGGENDARLDPDVRKAMALAIDRAWLVDNPLLGLADPGSTVVPPINSYWHYEPSSSELMSYNVTAASQLLESSGYVDVDSDGIRECTVTSRAVQMGWVDEGTELHFEVPVFKRDGSVSKDIAQFLKTEWHEIGVDAAWFVYDDSFFPIYCPIQQDVSVSWWNALDPDPEFVLFTQSDAGLSGWSDTGFSNASYNENFTLSVSSLDSGARKAYVDACQRILYDQCAYIILAYPHSNYVWWNYPLSGWGDWAGDPGRSLDACWGANPLFFDLGLYSYSPSPESEPSTLSLALNGVIVVVLVGTVTVAYLIWKRGPRTEVPPKT